MVKPLSGKDFMASNGVPHLNEIRYIYAKGKSCLEVALVIGYGV